MSAYTRRRGLQLIGERRVCIVEAFGEGTHVRAVVIGNSAVHHVEHNFTGWSCTCPAHRYHRSCSHIAAVQLVAGPGTWGAGATRPRTPTTAQIGRAHV